MQLFSLQELLDFRELGTLPALDRLANAGDEANFDVTENVCEVVSVKTALLTGKFTQINTLQML